MGILDEIISEFKTDDMIVQLRELCNQIKNEEIKNIKHHNRLPKGPNIFLSLEIPGINHDQISYITLERDLDLEGEDGTNWLIGIWTVFSKFFLNDTKGLKRVKTYKIEGKSTKKILTEFAKKVKFYRGE
ncbi:MAG: hypothetical protein PVG65_00710 [Candidatus Thorarchaeota archaeon]|jgi:hypothetical protein